MALTPDEIEQHTFRERFRGYDPEEVDAFLDRVVAALRTAERERDAAARERDDAVAAREVREDHSESEELLRKTLLNAQRTAEQTLREANADAERIREGARDQARGIVADARAQAHAVADAVEELLAAHRRLRQSLRGVLDEHAALLERDDELPATDDLVARLRRIDDDPAAGDPAAGPEAGGTGATDQVAADEEAATASAGFHQPAGGDGGTSDRAARAPAGAPAGADRAGAASQGIGFPQPPPANGEPRTGEDGQDGAGDIPPVQPPPSRGQ